MAYAGPLLVLRVIVLCAGSVFAFLSIPPLFSCVPSACQVVSASLLQPKPCYKMGFDCRRDSGHGGIMLNRHTI